MTDDSADMSQRTFFANTEASCDGKAEREDFDEQRTIAEELRIVDSIKVSHKLSHS